MATDNLLALFDAASAAPFVVAHAATKGMALPDQVIRPLLDMAVKVAPLRQDGPESAASLAEAKRTLDQLRRAGEKDQSKIDAAEALVADIEAEVPSIDAQAAFWSAMAEATKVIAPATADSIRNLYCPDLEYRRSFLLILWDGVRARLLGGDGRVFTHARVLVESYMSWALIVMALLVGAQILSNVAGSRLGQIDLAEAKLAEIVAEIAKTETSAEKSMSVEEKPDDLRELYIQRNAAVDKVADAYWSMLHVAEYLPLFDTTNAVASILCNGGDNPVDAALAKCPANAGVIEGTRGIGILPGRSGRLAIVEAIFSAFGNILMPLFFGAIGALAYVLRDLSRTIHDYTLRRISDVGYRLRFILGGLAGIAVGWVLPVLRATGGAPDLGAGGGDANSAMVALGLAFVAGYSIDILFNFLDRIVAALGTTKPQP